MSNWAKVDFNNNVLNVETAEQSWITNFIKENPDIDYRYIKETVDTKPACVDGTYDPENNKFITPKPYTNWVLNSNFDWVPPVAKPNGNFQWNQIENKWEEFFPPTKPRPIDGRVYRWDIDLQDWVVLE